MTVTSYIDIVVIDFRSSGCGSATLHSIVTEGAQLHTAVSSAVRTGTRHSRRDWGLIQLPEYRMFRLSALCGTGGQRQRVPGTPNAKVRVRRGSEGGLGQNQLGTQKISIWGFQVRGGDESPWGWAPGTGYPKVRVRRGSEGGLGQNQLGTQKISIWGFQVRGGDESPWAGPGQSRATPTASVRSYLWASGGARRRPHAEWGCSVLVCYWVLHC